jgi:type IV secretory pathway VirB3-like protein
MTDEVPWDSLSVGATRPAVIKGLNVPFWFVLPITLIPMLVVSITKNPLWLLLIVLLTLAGRLVVARDHNRPRVMFLALMSGSVFADRRRWGGVTTDPLTDSHGY